MFDGALEKMAGPILKSLGVDDKSVIAAVNGCVSAVNNFHQRLLVVEQQTADTHRMVAEMYAWHKSRDRVVLPENAS